VTWESCAQTFSLAGNIEATHTLLHKKAIICSRW